MTAPDETKRFDALQLIFSLFLGLLLVVVIGLGVWTFFPEPYGADSPEQKRLDKLWEEQSEHMEFKEDGTSKEDPEVKRIQAEIDELNEKMQDAHDDWALNTSIILLVFATILMAISLFLPEHMSVFSNGILLGGLFTMVYGTGWSFAGGDSRARFFVVLTALVLSMIFGYLRFILRGRRRTQTLAAAGLGQLASDGVGGTPTAPAIAAIDAAGAADAAAALVALDARVAALEAREAALVTAFGGGIAPAAPLGQPTQPEKPAHPEQPVQAQD